MSRHPESVRTALAKNTRLALFVYHRDGVETVHLRPWVPVVIGRAPPAHVRINQSSLSREHACFLLSEGKVIVEDLGSTNGTWVGGQRIARRELGPNEEVSLGKVLVCVVALGSAGDALPGFLSYDRLRGALEDELVRGRCLRHPLAVLVVRSSSESREPVGRWFAQVQALLRPVDRVALYSPDTAAILLPEAGVDFASDLARKITALRAGGEAPLLVGLASFPGAAEEAEELLALCLQAAQRATAEHPFQPLLGTPAADRAERCAAPGAPVSASPAMRQILATVSRLARASIPVLLHGETGTGKEVVARAIHEHGPRRAQPMVSVNCGALPVHLVESTLFGHERGAFTGAVQQHKGVFEAAHGGTVLLDEVGELPPAAQVALLRVLETSRVVRVGSNREIDVDVRLVAATHRDLEALCASGAFRCDLLYRLNAMTLVIPPLRQRPEDIPPLVERFLEHANQASGRSIRGVSPDAFEMLMKYSWPGNVRELRNAVERAVVIAEGDVLQVCDLSERIRAAALPARPASGDLGEAEDDSSEATAPASGGSLKARIVRYEAALIVSALRETGWNQTEAARRLGLPLRTLVHKLRVLGIRKLGYEAPDESPPERARRRPS